VRRLNAADLTVFVPPVMAGGPHSTSFVLITLTSFFLVADISSKYLHQEGKLSLGAFFETFRNEMPVSVVEMPLGLMIPACLNHLSDWLSLIVEPSEDLSPNLENS